MPLFLVGHIFIVLIENIFGCPVVPFTFGGEIWGYIYVNSGSAGLTDLQSGRNGVSVAIFHEVGASLMKRERHASLNALAAHIEHPFVATFPIRRSPTPPRCCHRATAQGSPPRASAPQLSICA